MAERADVGLESLSEKLSISARSPLLDLGTRSPWYAPLISHTFDLDLPNLASSPAGRSRPAVCLLVFLTNDRSVPVLDQTPKEDHRPLL